MFFFLAVTMSALLGNFRAGLLAIALSFIAVGTWIMVPIGLFQLTPDQIFQLIGFAIVATLISALAYTVKRAHQSVYEQTEWLRITLASIGDAVIATDLQGNVVWMNAVAASLTGWSIEQATALPLSKVFNIVNEQTRLPVANPVERVLGEGRVVGLANHTLLIAQDGTERPIDDSASPIRDAQGRIIGAVLIFHDISERRERERMLQAAEERLRLALNAGHIVAWEWDVAHDKIWTTDNFADIYGVPPIQLTSEGVQLLHPDDFAHHQATVQSATAQGGYHLEFRIIRPDDGRIVWIEEWGFAVPGEADQPLKYIVGVSIDITERKIADEKIGRLNAELAQRVQELQAVFDLVLVGIAVAYDPSCEVIVRNQMLAEWLGVPKGSGPSKSSPVAATLPFRMLRNGEEIPPDSLPMQRAIAEGRSVINEEVELARHDGFQVTVLVSATPIYDEEGHVSGCVCIYTDITERKAAETLLRNLNLTLERRVAERTAELELMNRELVEFTTVVSHDLRSPLRAINMLSNWIGEEAGDVLAAGSKAHLAKIQQRVRRMDALLNDLVAYTRAGRVHYQIERIDAALLVRDVMNLLDVPPGFTVTMIEPMPHLTAERVPLETVLRNLIGNAIKHHHQVERGHVIISARDLEGMVEFTVTDDGPGIASEYQERIFRVFQTLRPRDQVEGSGMGLAIVKRLVEGRGGTIEVKSLAGNGCTFTFTWPKQST
jgi:PAS domain S-box-containing protein